MSIKYFQESRPEMLELINQNYNRVLDVGCAEGNFAEQLFNQGCKEVWGVELNKAASEIAQKKLTKVINAEYNDKIELPKNYFDIIFFNDVLEHIIDPWEALKLSKQFLAKSKKSKIICSIPNFRYIKNIFEVLVKKDFQYKDSLILDKTHMRFFTKKSIIRMFSECGLEIISIKGINPTKKLMFEILNLVTLNFISDMRYLQFAVVARIKE